MDEAECVSHLTNIIHQVSSPYLCYNDRTANHRSSWAYFLGVGGIFAGNLGPAAKTCVLQRSVVLRYMHAGKNNGARDSPAQAFGENLPAATQHVRCQALLRHPRRRV